MHVWKRTRNAAATCAAGGERRPLGASPRGGALEAHCRDPVERTPPSSRAVESGAGALRNFAPRPRQAVPGSPDRATPAASLGTSPIRRIIRQLMFDTLTDKFSNVFRNLSGRGRISEENVREAMREV